MVVYARICEAVNASGLAITTFLAWWRWLRPWRWTWWSWWLRYAAHRHRLVSAFLRCHHCCV